MSVLIADDHPVVRQGLRTFLELQEDMEIVGEAAGGEEAVALVQELLPDVVLMDLVMPGVDGVEATRRIRDVSPATKVIALTSFTDDETVFASIKAGAAGYLLKDVRPQALSDAIRTVHRGEALLHPTIAAKLMQEFAQRDKRSAKDPLTEREHDVLRHIARGMSNKEIAAALVLSEKTIKTHVSNILQKLHLADRTQAALYAVKEGLVKLE
ncbi:MAG: response regulator transcription factor [Chloroflexi bacterium]|nr:response regulator transcription factor [Chloroflexota bacterium]